MGAAEGRVPPARLVCLCQYLFGQGVGGRFVAHGNDSRWFSISDPVAVVVASAVCARVVGGLLLVVWGCDVAGVPELGVECSFDTDDDGDGAPGLAAEQAADCVLGDSGDVGDFF